MDAYAQFQELAIAERRALLEAIGRLLDSEADARTSEDFTNRQTQGFDLEAIAEILGRPLPFETPEL